MDLYYVPGSAPCRGVLLAGKAVGVDFNLKLTNLMAGEHLKPEYIKVRYCNTHKFQYNKFSQFLDQSSTHHSNIGRQWICFVGISSHYDLPR
jgi:hypothetical protein